MPIVLRYSLAMTVADCVFMATQVWGMRHGLVGRLVIIASIVLVGVVGGTFAERDTNPRANAFRSGLSITLAYLGLDSLARTVFGVYLYGVPPTWRALIIPLEANALVILVVGMAASTLAAGIPAPDGGRAAESRRRFGVAVPTLLVVALSYPLGQLEASASFATAIMVVTAITIPALAWYYWYQTRLGTAYRRYCEAKGFGYAASLAEADANLLPQDHAAVLDALWGSGLPPTHPPVPTHIITGQWGDHPFCALHYADVTYPEDIRRRGVMLWEVPSRTFPQFVLVPEGFWDRLAETFGAQDIDFDGDPDFSRAYRLRGSEESAVRALFTPDVRRFLTAHPGQRVAGVGRCLAWWVDGGLPNPGALDAFLERGDAVRRAFGA